MRLRHGAVCLQQAEQAPVIPECILRRDRCQHALFNIHWRKEAVVFRDIERIWSHAAKFNRPPVLSQEKYRGV